MTNRAPPKLSAPSSLEALLREERLVDDAALREARRVALRRRVPLIEVLVDEHTVDEGVLADAFARRLDLPRVPLSAIGQDEEALREVPHDLAATHLAVPVELDSEGARRTLRVAMADPLDAFAIEDLAQSNGCTIEPVVASLGDIRAAIQRSYRGLITKMIPRFFPSDEPRPTGEPTTQPHLQLPDETSLELRLRALMDLLVERGVVTAAEVDERVRRLVRGEDV